MYPSRIKLCLGIIQAIRAYCTQSSIFKPAILGASRTYKTAKNERHQLL